MDKEKFLKWLNDKINIVLTETPDKFLENPEQKAYMKAVINVMDEIKLQVESGKFDDSKSIKAYKEANNAIYFDDNSDYQTALYQVCMALNPSINPEEIGKEYVK